MAKAIPHSADQDESYALDANMSDPDGDAFYKRIVPEWNVAAQPEDRNLADLDAKRAALGLS